MISIFSQLTKISSSLVNKNFAHIVGSDPDPLFIVGETPAGIAGLLYQVAFPYRANTIAVYVAGLRLIPGTEYTETKINVTDANPQQILFATTPSGAIRVDYMRADL